MHRSRQTQSRRSPNGFGRQEPAISGHLPISEINRLNNDFLINADDNLRAPDQLAMAYKFGQKRFGWSDEKMRTILSG